MEESRLLNEVADKDYSSCKDSTTDKAPSAPLDDDDVSNAPSRNKSSAFFMKRLYHKSLCYKYKGSFILLIVTSLVFFLIDYNSGDLPNLLVNTAGFFIFTWLALCGEMFPRYRVILISAISVAVLKILISIIIVVIVSVFKVDFDQSHENVYIVIKAVLVFLILLPTALYQSNIIQFGTDQMMFAPSIDIMAFIYWLLLTYLLSPIVTGFFQYLSGAVKTQSTTSKYIIYLILMFVTCTATILAIILLVCCKKHINLEPPSRVNPVRLIYRVIKYALTHKVPSFRSAFTYGEGMPGRLDLAKSRYGGPFTTDQVEDVKSFINIFMVLLSFSGCYVFETNDAIVKVLQNSTQRDAESLAENIILNYPNVYQSLITIVGILLFPLTLFRVPCYSTKIPSQLERMAITVLISVFTSVIYFSACLSIDYFPIVFLYIPLTLDGVSMLFSYTIFEFIVAQASCTMQGLLIGMYFSLLSLRSASVAIGTNIPKDYIWIFYLMSVVIVVISSLMYARVAAKYAPRRRNEISTINEKIIIEEYCERNLLVDEDENTFEENFSFDIKSIKIS